jgi:hypothetical protein
LTESTYDNLGSAAISCDPYFLRVDPTSPYQVLHRGIHGSYGIDSEIKLDLPWTGLFRLGEALLEKSALFESCMRLVHREYEVAHLREYLNGKGPLKTIVRKSVLRITAMCHHDDGIFATRCE